MNNKPGRSRVYCLQCCLIVCGNKPAVVDLDTNIIGAQVNAKQVTADVGGNLNIQSIQDVTTSAAHQSSAGGGFDYGRVFGPNTELLAGTQLAGAVIGIRGSMPAKFVGVSYDLFAGTPIYKPSGFPTARVTVGFQLTAAF